MTQEQIAYANFIKTICESYNCADATRPLQEGFAALCEAQALNESWLDTAKKAVLPLAVAAGIVGTGEAAKAAHDYDTKTRAEMFDAHWGNCGIAPQTDKLQYMPSNNSEQAVETAYQLQDQLDSIANADQFGGKLVSPKFQNRISKDIKAVENAKDDAAKKAATQQLNLDIRQGNNLVYTISHGKCPDGKSVYASPQSTIFKTWKD